MENRASSTCKNGELFCVVYDPRFDRFFLEDEVLHAERSRSLDRKAVTIPWNDWLVPPRMCTNPEIALTTVETSKEELCRAQTAESLVVGPRSHHPVPELDLSALTSSVPASQATKSVTPHRRTRVDNYETHFELVNKQVAESVLADAKPDNAHEVKWNGDVLRVRVAGLRSTDDGSNHSHSNDRNVLQGRPLPQALADDQSLGSTFELKTLLRIRPHADGFRGTAVNSACQFVALSESSESSEDEVELESSETSEEAEPRQVLPIFFRGDRVLFQAQHRWNKGTIRRRIPHADFYDVRAANGTLFEAVVASNIQLLQQKKEKATYRFKLGDKVLWIPEPSVKAQVDKHQQRRRTQEGRHTQETYKARVVQVRSLNRFDLLLRTGRLVSKVPYEQLRPRDPPSPASCCRTRRR